MPACRDETVAAAGIILFDMLAYVNAADFPSRIRDKIALVQSTSAPAPAADADAAFAELRQLGEECLASMRSILAVPLGTRLPGDDSSLDDLNEALEVVRQSLEQHRSPYFENFMWMIRTRDLELFTLLEKTRQEYLAYTLEAERALILFGAGSDDDVDLIGDVVPDVT